MTAENGNTIALITDNITQIHEIERTTTVLQEEVGGQLSEMLTFIRGDAQKRELHEVERSLFHRLLELGRTLLQLFLAEKGPGYEGKELERSDGSRLPFHQNRARDYASIFGKIEVERAYYWKGGAEGHCPLDAKLNLPSRSYSYLLQELAALLGAGDAFDQVTDILEKFLRVKLWKQGVQTVMREAGGDVQEFYEAKPAPSQDSEGDLLVIQIDGKGVPVRREEPREKKLRRGRGEKPNKKKEAVVSAVYTADRQVRTAADILHELADDGTVIDKDGDERTPAPSPKNKCLRATMAGKDAAFEDVRRQVEARDPDGIKERVVLTDGCEALQDRAEDYLDGPSGVFVILDLFHVMEYLWEAVYAFHSEGTPEAAHWVTERLRLLLEGKVSYVIGGLRQSITKRGLRGRKRKAVEKAIGYFDRNRDRMIYNEYLEFGYPIATGVAEGACRNLVKDRMERTGMRWTIAGAQAVLDLRATKINDDWEEFWEYRIARERRRLYDSPGPTRNPVRAAA